MPHQKKSARHDESLREQLIGLGERSLRKSYYPELQQRVDDLKRFRALLDQSYDLIFLLNIPGGKIVDINESACKQLGYARDRLLFTAFNVLISTPNIPWSGLLSAQESEKSDHYRETMVTSFKRCDGSSIPVEVNLSLVSFENDRYAVVVARDITDRLRVEEELKVIHQLLEQRVEERTAALLQLSESLKAEIAERKKAEEQLKYLSLHDYATGLYNRAYFSEEMRRLDTGRHYPISLIMCDVDGLKMVNDSLGHDAGDQLLLKAARLLRAGVREGDVVARLGGDEFAILLAHSAPHDVEQVVMRINSMNQTGNQNSLEVPLSISLGYATSTGKNKSTSELFKEADNNMYKVKAEQKEMVYQNIVKALNRMLRFKDNAEQGHIDNLTRMCEIMGRSVKLPGESIRQLKLLAEYHDLGKLRISDKILLKPGRLTPEERAEVELHCEMGCQIARSVPELVPVADLILKHHEWWNGQGYPLGLKGEEIPLQCRILSIVDAFDVMTNTRPYSKAMPWDEAINELRKMAGTQFDGKLVDIFIDLWG